MISIVKMTVVFTIMYYENMNNANYLQHDIQFEAFQGVAAVIVEYQS